MDPEAEIRKQVSDIVASVEAKNLGPFSDALADNFTGPQGAARQEVKQMVAFYVLRGDQAVSVFNPSLSVEILGVGQARMNGLFVFASTKAKTLSEVSPTHISSVYRIKATLEKSSGEWKFTHAEYESGQWP
jgi:hypothetical protein